MLFNSISFLFFLIAVVIAYFGLPHKYRWLLLLLVSCLFYMSFIPIYIIIIFATIIIDYFAAIGVENTKRVTIRRNYLLLSILSVLSILCYFKYWNFLVRNVNTLARMLDWNYSHKALDIILPVGLSFHTFQSLSYVIEVYRGNVKAERHFGIYALFVMYFPQLVAGPIERPQNLLHQFHERKWFNWQLARDGLSLSLWGLFKKVVVSDSLAIYVNAIYNNSEQHNGTSLLLATYFFSIQIYCDFSGYSDIARGISKIFGIELMKNFDTPYFSTSLSEFWTRWHISLSTWFRDYVYIPLGGNRVPLIRNCINLSVVFVLSGLWHGANWTFVFWGGVQGLFLVAERVYGKIETRRRIKNCNCARGKKNGLLTALITFHVVALSWVFFRSPDIKTAFVILRKIAFEHGRPFIEPILVQGGASIIVLLIADMLISRTRYFQRLDEITSFVQIFVSVSLLFGIVLFGIDYGAQFIYFQF
jgi:D-alanyl-lipoteichoic acid acyltransferase DltB (MBOAT superfamily)